MPAHIVKRQIGHAIESVGQLPFHIYAGRHAHSHTSRYGLSIPANQPVQCVGNAGALHNIRVEFVTHFPNLRHCLLQHVLNLRSTGTKLRRFLRKVHPKHGQLKTDGAQYLAYLIMENARNPRGIHLPIVDVGDQILSSRQLFGYSFCWHFTYFFRFMARRAVAATASAFIWNFVKTCSGVPDSA